MYIVNYFDYENKSLLIAEIRKCDWGAAKFLADILEQNRFEELLGGGELFVLMDGDKIVSYCTLTKNDCVKDDTLYPWIGFLFTVPEYRGHRYSEQVIDKAYVTAIEQGAFQLKSNIKSVIIPDSVTYIGAMAFYSCKNLASVTLGENVKSIGAFQSVMNSELKTSR